MCSILYNLVLGWALPAEFTKIGMKGNYIVHAVSQKSFKSTAPINSLKCNT